MKPTQEAPTSPLEAARAQWRLVAVIVVVFAVIGFVFAGSRHTRYTAESRLAVGSSSLDAVQVAGFSQGTEDLASNYARYVSDATAQAQVDATLGARANAVISIDASPIPDSNVVRIEVVATDPAVASQAANAVADQLIKVVTAADAATGPAATLQQINAITAQLTSAQVAVTQATARIKRAISPGGLAADEAVLSSANQQLTSLQVQQTALSAKYQAQIAAGDVASGLTSIQRGTITGDDHRSRQERYALAGIVLGAVLGLLAATWLERRRDRRFWAEQGRGVASTSVTGTESTGSTGSTDSAQEVDEAVTESLVSVNLLPSPVANDVASSTARGPAGSDAA